jgi:hypothetical protein
MGCSLIAGRSGLLNRLREARSVVFPGFLYFLFALSPQRFAYKLELRSMRPTTRCMSAINAATRQKTYGFIGLGRMGSEMVCLSCLPCCVHALWILNRRLARTGI